MQKPAIPANEAERLAALKAYEILDTLPEKLYDNIALLASQICGTPLALVSLVDETRQWFKSHIGVDATQVDRELSFCGHAILQKEVFQISNLALDPRFADNPLVTSGPRVIFYAGAPLKTPSGQQIGTLCVIDHQPRSLTPQQTHSLAALADQVVALLEMRLSTRKAVEASKAKSDFLAHMSHEIRTPLGAILGFAEVLEDASLSAAERTKYLGIIMRNGQILSHLVDDLLDISKIEAQQLKIEVRENSMRELLAGLQDLFTPSAAQKKIQFFVDAAPGLPERLRFDALRVRQILNNIIGNAIKFTSEGSVRLRASHQDGCLVFTITDTGRGISEEQAQKLFRPFAQAEAVTSQKYGGTGLGLYLTRQLCTLMGGDFTLRSSRLGEGSTFVARIHATPVLSVPRPGPDLQL